MARLLFRLNGVPDDEADDIRELLEKHGIDFYETSAGRWGISIAAIWLKDESQWDESRRLIDEYQSERQIRIQGEYAALKREGRHETIFTRFCRDPLRFLLYLALIAAIIYLTLLPFVAHW